MNLNHIDRWVDLVVVLEIWRHCFHQESGGSGEGRLRPSQWLWLVLCVSFSALTMLGGWHGGQWDPVPVIPEILFWNRCKRIQGWHRFTWKNGHWMEVVVAIHTVWVGRSVASVCLSVCLFVRTL